MTINRLRTILYTAAKLLGDINAVLKGRIGRRIGRRLAGKISGRLLGSFPLGVVREAFGPSARTTRDARGGTLFRDVLPGDEARSPLCQYE